MCLLGTYGVCKMLQVFYKITTTHPSRSIHCLFWSREIENQKRAAHVPLVHKVADIVTSAPPSTLEMLSTCFLPHGAAILGALCIDVIPVLSQLKIWLRLKFFPELYVSFWKNIIVVAVEISCAALTSGVIRLTCRIRKSLKHFCPVNSFCQNFLNCRTEKKYLNIC